MSTSPFSTSSHSSPMTSSRESKPKPVAEESDSARFLEIQTNTASPSSCSVKDHDLVREPRQSSRSQETAKRVSSRVNAPGLSKPGAPVVKDGTAATLQLYERIQNRVAQLEQALERSHLCTLSKEVSASRPAVTSSRNDPDRIQRLVDEIYKQLLSDSYDPLYRSEVLTRIWLRCSTIPSALRCQELRRIDPHPFKISALSNVYSGELLDASSSPVALKAYRISQENYRTKIPQFFLEAEIWRSLSHPSILEFLGINICDDGVLYLVSPLMKGSTLPEYLSANQSSNEEKLRILAQISEGLTHVHSRPTPVIHGDLRGMNILINERGEPVIADFGCSMIIRSSSSNPLPDYHLHAGSPRWTAPEKLRKSEHLLGIESDTYSFACLILEVLSGRIPFYDLRNDAAVVIAVFIKGQQPSHPSDVSCPELMASIWPFLTRCWSHNPSQRPSINEVREALLSYIS